METKQERVMTIALAAIAAFFLTLILSSCGTDTSKPDYEPDISKDASTEDASTEESQSFFEEYFSECIEWCNIDYDFVVTCGTITDSFISQREIFVDACLEEAWFYGCTGYGCRRNISIAVQKMDTQNLNAYCEGYTQDYFDTERKPSGILERQPFYLRCHQ